MFIWIFSIRFIVVKFFLINDHWTSNKENIFQKLNLLNLFDLFSCFVLRGTEKLLASNKEEKDDSPNSYNVIPHTHVYILQFNLAYYVNYFNPK